MDNHTSIMETNKAHAVSVILLIATAILWSMGGLLIKLVSWNSIAIAGGRSTIAAVFILILIKKPSLKWDTTMFLGALAYAGTVILFVVATKITTAANAILLQYTAPIYIAIFGAWFLKEKTTIFDWTIIGVVLGGMVLFFLDNIQGGSMMGNLLAIISGMCFAFTILFMKKQRNGSPLESVFWGNVLTGLIGLPFMFKAGMPDSQSVIGLLLLGVFQLGLAYVLYAIAIKHVTALEGVLIPIIEPILNPVWVLIVTGERPGRFALVGGIVVVGAIAFRSIAYTLKVMNGSRYLNQGE